MLEPGEESGVARVAAGETADQQYRVVLLRDILQMSMREERQDPASPATCRFSAVATIFNGVDRPTGVAIHRAEDLQWADEVELIDRRHDDD
ncbi:MAG TPA: hypothetical protein VMQ17_12570 [Candidatus Sulfotelmatobacter sp.]|nr:hypothetical protein [Candidatus Sulfotelmatobacter sp.]